LILTVTLDLTRKFQGNLLRHFPEAVRRIVGFSANILFWSEEQAALTVIGCAWNDRLFKERITGQYFVPVWRQDRGGPQAQNVTLAKSWFDQTEDLLRSKSLI
jgi:hypothetical protein